MTGKPPLKYMLLHNVVDAGSRRRNPRGGDAFVYRPGKSSYFWGRLIRTPCTVLESKGHLIFLYDASTNDRVHAPWDLMRPDNLLVPPIITNSTPWTKGFFRMGDNRAVQEEDLLEPVFFVNDRREPVNADGEPVRASSLAPDAMLPTFGLYNVRLLDELLKQRLGVPTLKLVVDRCVSSFCNDHDIRKPEPGWIAGIMIALDEERPDKILDECLSRAFSFTHGAVLGELARELREAAGQYRPELMEHIRSGHSVAENT